MVAAVGELHVSPESEGIRTFSFSVRGQRIWYVD